MPILFYLYILCFAWYRPALQLAKEQKRKTRRVNDKEKHELWWVGWGHRVDSLTTFCQSLSNFQQLISVRHELFQCSLNQCNKSSIVRNKCDWKCGHIRNSLNVFNSVAMQQQCIAFALMNSFVVFLFLSLSYNMNSYLCFVSKLHESSCEWILCLTHKHKHRSSSNFTSHRISQLTDWLYKTRHIQAPVNDKLFESCIQPIRVQCIK